jgi:DNA polymerase
MPSLAAFAALAERAGVVPHVPQRAEGRGTGWGAAKHGRNQCLGDHVPHVPLANNDANDEGRDEFEERAAILEFDAGHTRAEAQILSRARTQSATGLLLISQQVKPNVAEVAEQKVDSFALKTTLVFCDFETRNTGGCKLPPAGAWRYAADPATEIITLSYRVGDGEHRLWTPELGRCDRLAALVADPDLRFVCHSAFEQAIWHHVMVERFGFAPVPIARWHDTQAACAYHALPLKLGQALTVINSPVVKDEEGRRLTLSLARSNRRTGEYPTITPETRERVATYNRIDGDGAMALDKALGPLPKRERRVWELDQAINRRGIAIDLDYVRAAKGISDRLMAGLSEQFRALTGGLNPTQVQATLRWLAKRGLILKSLDGDTITETLKSDDLPPDLLRVLKIRATVAASSLKKLDSMLECVGADGRVRGSLQYHGAMTGRWAGRLLQPQNLPRPTVKIDDPEALVAAVKTGDVNSLRLWGDDPIEVLVSGLRHAIIARDGSVLGSGDFATIEARIVLAIAGQDDKVALLASGADVYRDMAAEILPSTWASRLPSKRG